MMKYVGVGVLVIAGLLLAPRVTSAQAISGTVTDAPGSVLPGVTVEARSPALIEQVRTVFTDGAGLYQIVELRPGTYSVTFMLTGFGTLIREGIELTTGFTANVDAQLRVGAVSETVTVTGATPVVDVQNVTQRQVATREIIDTVPVAKSFQSLGVLIPGIVTSGTTSGLPQDVGGQSGQNHMTMDDVNGVKQLWSMEAKKGRPIKRDRLWFFATHNRFVTDNWAEGMYFNQDERGRVYDPDRSQQALAEQNAYQTPARLTWQAM